MIYFPLTLFLFFATVAMTLSGCAPVQRAAQEKAAAPRTALIAVMPPLVDSFIREFGSLGSGPAQFRDPSDISINSLGQILVADTGNDRIVLFSAAGKHLSEAGGFGFGERQFHHPLGLDAQSVLDIWVADTFNRRTVHMDGALNFIATVGELSDRGDEITFGEPADVVLAKTGELFLLDKENDRLLLFTPHDLAGRELAGYGSGIAALDDPASLALDQEGSIYVADRGNNRIVVFDSFGGFMRQILGFNAPSGVSISPGNTLIIADTGNHRIVACSLMGKQLASFGAEGSGLGGLSSPKAAEIDRRGRLIVLDSGNNRVQIWQSAGFR